MARIDGWRANILVLPVGLADDTLSIHCSGHVHTCLPRPLPLSKRTWTGSRALGVGSGSGEWGVGSGEWGVGSGEWGVGSGELGVGSCESGRTDVGRPSSERWCLFHISPRPSVRAEYKVYFALGCTSVLIDIRDMPVAASFGGKTRAGGAWKWGEKCGWLAGGLPRKATRLTPDRMWMPPLRRSKITLSVATGSSHRGRAAGAHREVASWEDPMHADARDRDPTLAPPPNQLHETRKSPIVTRLFFSPHPAFGCDTRCCGFTTPPPM
jgi:hypothetical protein